ncbi:hypothetical protein ID007_004321 [Salmonella enterica]|nr:hypothetical protein [Salmonella enterica]
MGKVVSLKLVENQPVSTGFDLYQMDFATLAGKIEGKRANAAAHKLAFEFKSIMDVIYLIEKSGGVCAYTGKHFSKAQDVTFERLNPYEGYTKENTLVVMKTANSHKSMLDAFEKQQTIPDEMKIKLLNKVVYRLRKKLKNAG